MVDNTGTIEQYVVIGTDDCSWCDLAKEKLNEEFGQYLYMPLHKNPWLQTLLTRANITTVPAIYAVDGTYIGGYNELEAHLTAAV